MERAPVREMESTRRRSSWNARAGRLCAGLSGPVILPVSAWAQEPPWGWHPMWGMWGMWGIGMLVIMLTCWVVIIVGLVLGIRWLATQGRESRSDSALAILRQRYARGEINKEEFDAKKRDLS